MNQLPLGARVYATGITLAALSLTIGLLAVGEPPSRTDTLLAVVCTGLIAATTLGPLPLSFKRKLVLDTSVLVAAVLLFPAGVAMLIAARRVLPVALHTPSEVKAAITGYGRADKAQVGAMVARILGLEAVPKPADAADALALAICHAWRTGGAAGAAQPDAITRAADGSDLTPAQRAWLAAERSAAVSGAARRVKE